MGANIFLKLTNKSKRKVYKEINKRYKNRLIAKGVLFNEQKHIPLMACSFYESYPHLFNTYKITFKS
jgi:hypothetical protein